MLTPLARILGLVLLGRWIDQLPPALARWVRLVVVLVVGFTPLFALWADLINYADALFWLQIETVTIWFWSSLRLWTADRFAAASGSARRGRGRSPGGGFARTFFPVHYGAFTLLPLLIGAGIYDRHLPPKSPLLVFVVVGLASLLVYGWSIRGSLLNGHPFEALDWVHAYARMAISYAALFIGIPLIPHESNGVDVLGNPGLGPALGSLVLGLKLIVEVVLWMMREAQNRSEDAHAREGTPQRY